MEHSDDGSMLKSFIDLCESSPKFLRPHIRSVIELCLKVSFLSSIFGFSSRGPDNVISLLISSLQVFSNEEIDSENRHLALEVIVTLCEVGSLMMKKESSIYIGPLIQHILKMMADLEDDEMWSFADEIVDEDNDRYVRKRTFRANTSVYK
jgi:hypothetical protein